MYHCVHASAGGSNRSGLWEARPRSYGRRKMGVAGATAAGRHACMWYGARPGIKNQTIRSTNQVVLAVSGTQQGGDEKHDDGALSLICWLLLSGRRRRRSRTLRRRGSSTCPQRRIRRGLAGFEARHTLSKSCCGSKSNSIPWNCLALASAFAVMRGLQPSSASSSAPERIRQMFGKKLRPRIQPAWDTKCNKL